MKISLFPMRIELAAILESEAMLLMLLEEELQLLLGPKKGLNMIKVISLVFFY